MFLVNIFSKILVKLPDKAEIKCMLIFFNILRSLVVWNLHIYSQLNQNQFLLVDKKQHATENKANILVKKWSIRTGDEFSCVNCKKIALKLEDSPCDCKPFCNGCAKTLNPTHVMVINCMVFKFLKKSKILQKNHKSCFIPLKKT